MNPYLSIEGAAGLTFLLACNTFVLIHSIKTKQFTTLHFCILGMATLYGAGMPIVIHGAETFTLSGDNFIKASMHFTIDHTALAFLAAAGVYLGWRSLPGEQRRKLGGYFSHIDHKHMVPWFFLMLFTSLLSMYLYTKDYGGFSEYFFYNRLIRAGHFNLFERSSFSFLKPFGGFSLLACIGFWGIVISRKAGALVWLGLIAAFVMSAYVLMAFAGRLGILIFVSTFVVSIMLVRRTSPLLWCVLLPAFAPVAIIIIFFISNYFDIKASDNLESFLVKQISFPFTGYFAQLGSGHKFLLFVHLILSPLYILPSSLTGSWLSSASQINTEIIHGSVKGVGGVTSGMPVDLITFGFMQFHFLGVFIYAFVFGFVLRAATQIASSFALTGVSAAMTAYISIRFAIFGIFYADPQHIIETNFALIASLMFFVCRRLVRRGFSKSGSGAKIM